MSWPLIIVSSGVLVTVALWATFVYIAVHEIKIDMPTGSFAESLDVDPAVTRGLDLCVWEIHPYYPTSDFGR